MSKLEPMSMEHWEQELRKATCWMCGLGKPIVEGSNPARHWEGNDICTYNPALLPIVQAAYQQGYDDCAKVTLNPIKAAAYAQGERAAYLRCARNCAGHPHFAGAFIQWAEEVKPSALPVEAAPAKSSDDIAWLAEALIPPRDGNPGTVHWVNMEHGALGFTTDPYKALRFARKEDVEAIATLYGFQGQNIKPVEHMWSGGPGAPSEAGSK